MARMWKENVKHGVEHPNGQLEQIFFAHFNRSFLHISHAAEHQINGSHVCLGISSHPTCTKKPDGTYALDYNPGADDFNKVPGWSTVDINTPKQSGIKPWYVYAPDIPDFEFDEGIIGFYICEICQESAGLPTCILCTKEIKA